MAISGEKAVKIQRDVLAGRSVKDSKIDYTDEDIHHRAHVERAASSTTGVLDIPHDFPTISVEEGLKIKRQREAQKALGEPGLMMKLLVKDRTGVTLLSRVLAKDWSNWDEQRAGAERASNQAQFAGSKWEKAHAEAQSNPSPKTHEAAAKAAAAAAEAHAVAAQAHIETGNFSGAVRHADQAGGFANSAANYGGGSIGKTEAMIRAAADARASADSVTPLQPALKALVALGIGL